MSLVTDPHETLRKPAASLASGCTKAWPSPWLIDADGSERADPPRTARPRQLLGHGSPTFADEPNGEVAHKASLRLGAEHFFGQYRCAPVVDP
jgi:hypothetical protein